MDGFVSKEVLDGLRAAERRAAARQSRLSLREGDRVHRVLGIWENGFALDASAPAKLRGLVDLYDGPRHLAQCLIIHSSLDGDRRVYEFKRRTEVRNSAPRDFAADAPAPAGLIAAV